MYTLYIYTRVSYIYILYISIRYMYTIYENYIYTRYSLHMFLNFDELCQFAKRQELPGMRRRFRQDVTLIHAQAEISTASNLLKKLFFSESVAIDQNLKDLLY